MKLGETVTFKAEYIKNRKRPYVEDEFTEEQQEQYEDEGIVSVDRYIKKEIKPREGILVGVRRVCVGYDLGYQEEFKSDELIPVGNQDYREIWLVATSLYSFHRVRPDWIVDVYGGEKA